MSINYTDVFVILMLIFFAYRAKKKGAIYLIVGLFGKLISLFASFMLYGTVSHYLRQTPLFDWIKDSANNAVAKEFSKIAPSQITEGGSVLSSMLSDSLRANDNAEIYKLFSVDTYIDYVACYIANISINIISIVFVYIIVNVLISAIFNTSRIVSRLPVIGQINSLLGMAGGLIQGIIIIWVLMIVLMFFTLQGKYMDIYEAVLSSQLAVYLLKYNILAKLVFEVIP